MKNFARGVQKDLLVTMEIEITKYTSKETAIRVEKSNNRDFAASFNPLGLCFHDVAHEEAVFSDNRKLIAVGMPLNFQTTGNSSSILQHANSHAASR